MSAVPSRTIHSLSEREFERILLVKPSSLGDIVHALPVLHGLRVRYPQARIDWLAGTAFAELLEGHPDLNELVVFDRARFGRVGASAGATAAFLHFVKSLRAHRYDLVIDLQGLFRSGFLARASGAPVRLGFAGAREAAWVFYTHRLQVPASIEHAADRNYQVATALGFAQVPMTFDLAVTAAERQRAAELLHGAGLPVGTPFAAVLPGARWETKRWPPERFAAVVDQLAADHGLPGVLMGSPDERLLCAAVAQACRRPPIDLAGRTGLREITAVLAGAAVVLCHDSAPMHLAAALGRPLVCILGPTNAARTGPYGTPATILQAALPCVPCYLRKLSQCRFKHQCMQDVSVAQVARAVAQAVQPTPRQADNIPSATQSNGRP